MKIAIAGLGTVGAETARQLLVHADHLATSAGQPLELVAVSARAATKDRGFSMAGISFEPDPSALAGREDVDCVVELIGGEEGPALALVEKSLEQGKSVVTANKALLSKHGHRLAELAEAKGVSLAGEAAVAGGIPCLKMIREGLSGNQISRVSGILNGTCNYILSTMEETGRDFDDVLAEAQSLGYAEADPGFDIDGIDAAHKLSLLASLAFGIAPAFDQMVISGIRSVNALDISCADNLGYVIRLLGIAERVDGSIFLSVQPTLVPKSSQLAKVTGPLNAVSVDGQPIGNVTAVGPGAGAGATASAVLADINDTARGRVSPFFGWDAGSLSPCHSPDDTGKQNRFYIRLTVYDRPGVLADVTAVLRDHHMSVESLIQQGRSDEGVNGSVPVVITTHEADSTAMQGAIAGIRSLDCVLEDPAVMVIADTSDDS